MAIQWVAAGAPEGVNCEKSYFDTVGIDVLKRNYFLDTLPPDEAEAAIAGLPGRVELPRVVPGPAPNPGPAPRLYQIRAPAAHAEATP